MRRYAVEFIGTFFLVLTIGCTGLGYGSSVEIFLVVRFDGGPLTEPMPTAGAAGD